MKYVLTTSTFEGSIQYGYSANGLLLTFDICAELPQDKHESVLRQLQHCLQVDSFLFWAGKYKFKVAQLQEDLSFEAFWKLYPVKRNKLDAERLWAGFSDTERQLIFINLRAYLRYCARNSNWYNCMYPDTYLRKHYKDEWDKS